MGMGRRALLWASTNERLRRVATRTAFVNRAVRKFMPGETLDEALEAARSFAGRGIPTTFTHLGENVASPEEARAATEHYLEMLDRIASAGLDVEVSPKLTQLGLDLDVGLAKENFARLVERARDLGNWMWIDMESSAYVDATLEVYRHALDLSPRAGVCLQAYLYRTAADLEGLLPHSPSIRLVKGAYREAPEISMQKKGDVDRAYLALSRRLLEAGREGRIGRFAAGTHDVDLLSRIADESRGKGLGRTAYEVQMLYGIREPDQFRLAEDGFPVRTLIAYGPAWYSWYVRRLAERPANLWFVARNVFSRRRPPSGARPAG